MHLIGSLTRPGMKEREREREKMDEIRERLQVWYGRFVSPRRG